MGVYDSVMTPCPKCGHREEFQSKGADFPYLERYDIEDAPDDVLGGVDTEDDAVCEECGTIFRLRVTRGRPVWQTCIIPKPKE